MKRCVFQSFYLVSIFCLCYVIYSYHYYESSAINTQYGRYILYLMVFSMLLAILCHQLLANFEIISHLLSLVSYLIFLISPMTERLRRQEVRARRERGVIWQSRPAPRSPACGSWRRPPSKPWRTACVEVPQLTETTCWYPPHQRYS